MEKSINTIFVDLGDTFRVIRKDEAYMLEAKTRIRDLLGADADPVDFYRDVIEPRYDKYREWALTFYCEAPEQVLWTRWLAYDFPRERVESAASELTYAYRRTKGERVVTDGGIDTVKELYRRGYTLGIVSDLVGVHEVDEWLDRDGLRPYFKTVQQSSVCPGGDRRRPGPDLLCGRQPGPGYRGRQGRRPGHDRRRAVSGQEAPDRDGRKPPRPVHQPFQPAAGHFSAAGIRRRYHG